MYSLTRFPLKYAAAALFLGLALVLGISSARWRLGELPLTAADVRVAASEFGSLIDEISEPEGFFDSDNFISNETSYLHVVGDLQKRVHPGGIYLGVGPDQNFSYIVHTRPSLAIIVDVRRQNMLQHLLLKALSELAETRYDYLCLLFSKERIKRNSGGSLEDLLQAVRSSPSSEQQFKENLADVKNILLGKYHLQLSGEDLEKVEYIYRTFFRDQLDLRFSSLGRPSYWQYPTFEELILETDRHGQHQNFLSNEALFLRFKRFQSENRLIPVVGDFAGPHAFKSIARFLKQRGLHVSAFYVSNVEFYLFGRPSWDRYVENVRSLPITGDSVFIRAYFSTFGRFHAMHVRGHRSTTLVQPILPFIKDYDAGLLHTYWDVVALHN